MFNRLEYINCNECPFKDYNKVLGYSETLKGNIIILGEAPGEKEDLEGKPFVGPAGKLLNLVLREVGINRSDCWITNRILCRPPNNNFSTDDVTTAVSICSVGLFKELKFLKEKGYKIIVPLGSNALKSFKLKGIGRYRGQVIHDIDLDMKIAPTYHPAYLVRNGGKVLKEENNKLWELWKKDFELIKEASNARE